MKIIILISLICLNSVTFAQDDFIKQAEEFSKQGKQDKCIEIMNKALLKDTTNAEYYSMKANCLLELKKIREAYSVLSKAIKLNPKEQFLYNNRGNLLLKIGEFDYAIEDFTRELDLSTSDTQLIAGFINRAAAKFSKRDFHGAYDDLQKAYQLDSTDSGVLVNLGAVCDEVGKGEETLKYLLKAVEINPADYPALGNIGFKYQEMGQYEKAVEYFNKVLQLQPDQALGFSNRSYNKLKLGDIKGAMTDINKSLELYPENSYAYRIRALIYIEMKDNKKACEDLKCAIDKGFTVTYGDEVVKLKEKLCK